MNENTRNAFASYGLEMLKRSVLLVLYDARDEGFMVFLILLKMGCANCGFHINPGRKNHDATS